jgi:phasin
MTENTAAARAKTSNAIASESPTSERPMTEGAESVRKLAHQGVAYTRDMYEKSKAATEETNKLLEQTYSTVAKGAVDFNLQWIEMARANSNSAFDFAREMVGVKSPSEFVELSAAHARKQFQAFTQQAQQLTSLAQKMTTDAVQPLRSGVQSALSKVA